MVNYLGKWAREFEKIQAETHEMISACFRQAVRVLGETEARIFWLDVAKRKRGKQKGTKKEERDAFILRVHDEWVRLQPKDRRKTPRLVGEYLAKTHPGAYGGSALAIEKQLRRLLSRRTPQRPGTQNALGEFARTGKLPIVDLPWDMDK
jgi:hypothetical protein